MSLANLALDIGRRNSNAAADVVDIITFIESPWGLGMRLFPVQRVILKAHYGLALDDNPHGFDLTRPIPKNHPDYEDLIDCPPRAATTRIEVVDPSEIPDGAIIRLLDHEGDTTDLVGGEHWVVDGDVATVLESIACAINDNLGDMFEAQAHFGTGQVFITSTAFSEAGNAARLELTDCSGFRIAFPEMEIHQEGYETNAHNFYGGMGGFYKWRVPITDWRRENPQVFTEKEYLEYLYENKRSNIREVIPGHERREMILSIGRRSGKTTISACIAAYESYKLISKGHPQGYYGLPDSNVIQIISVATDKDQAGLLYREVHGHFTNCFFHSYMANATQTFATFQTPRDIERFGSYKDDNKARFSIKVTFRSCVAKGLRGAGNIVVILDEVAHFTDAGQSSAKAVYDAITPSTSAFSQKDEADTRVPIGPVEGRIILISSPLGRQGQFYRLFQIGMGGGRAARNMLCIEAPTWEVNPTIPAHEFEKHYIKDAAVFFTEYGGQFTDRTRGWIDDTQDLLVCVDPLLRPKVKAPPRFPHFMGIDIALVGDYCALAIGHNDDKGNVILDLTTRIKAGEGDFAHLERLEFDDVADWVFAHSRKFFITEGMFDQWAGIPFEQALNKRGLKQMNAVHHTKSLNSQMYQNFKDMMFDRRLTLYDHPIAEGQEHCDYITELLELQAETVSKYIVVVEAPNMEGKHDDYADAIVRMVWMATNHASKTRSFGTRKGTGVKAVRPPASPLALAKARARAKLGGSHPSRMVPRRGGMGGPSGTGRR